MDGFMVLVSAIMVGLVAFGVYVRVFRGDTDRIPDVDD